MLDGNLEVVPLGPERCRVVLTAAYRPPFERAGQLLDQAFLHRVAESTVRSFLTQLACTVETDVVAGADVHGADAHEEERASTDASSGAAGDASWRLRPLH